MSRGFVKEGDQEEPPMIPPRAALPPGATNYVTPIGYDALLKERELLESERKNLPNEDARERRRAVMVIDGKLELLNKRIASARIVKNKDQPKDEVRFGATVEFYNGQRKLKFHIVGVDEADIKKQKASFTAPIIRSMIGAKVDETVEFKRENGILKLKILAITYT